MNEPFSLTSEEISLIETAKRELAPERDPETIAILGLVPSDEERTLLLAYIEALAFGHLEHDFLAYKITSTMRSLGLVDDRDEWEQDVANMLTESNPHAFDFEPPRSTLISLEEMLGPQRATWDPSAMAYELASKARKRLGLGGRDSRGR